jgi:FKBP-type peptidyl-prolyl cis-trans isomerase FklB
LDIPRKNVKLEKNNPPSGSPVRFKLHHLEGFLMKFAWLAIVSVFLMACQGNTQEQAHMKSMKDSISYSIGMNIGKDLKNQSIDVDPQLIAAGIKDMISGAKPQLTDEQIQSCMTSLQTEMMAKQQVKNKEVGEKNMKDGQAFLEANKAKEGVKVTASGLQYKILKEGNGAKPTATSTVSVHYRGTTIDGTEFDSSIKRGQPAEFPVNGVIKGWTEALQLMPVGSKWQLVIPAELAYGAHGAGAAIGPNAVLIFEVELLAIK